MRTGRVRPLGSVRPDRVTPRPFFERLDAEFGFTLDVCADPQNARCARYFTPADDGLARDWVGTCWCHPPDGPALGRWVACAAWQAERHAATVVCLLPARTEAWWFHRHVVGTAVEVRFVVGRPGPADPPAVLPVPAMVVVYRPHEPDDTFGVVTRMASMIDR